MKIFDKNYPDDLYVLIVEDDLGMSRNADFQPRLSPVVLETPLDQLSLAMAHERESRIGGRFGRTRIAKLSLLEE